MISPALRPLCPTRARASLLMSLLLPLLLSLLFFSRVVEAHDANLARWDLKLEEGRWVLYLRTSGAGLAHSLQLFDPQQTASTGDSWSVEAYQRRLKSFLRSVVVLREGGRRLALTGLTYQAGHEASVRLSFERAPQALARTALEQAQTLSSNLSLDLSLDLKGFTQRPHQHHLVLIHLKEGRQRVMLSPDAGYTLTCSLTHTHHTPHRSHLPHSNSLCATSPSPSHSSHPPHTTKRAK